MALLQLSTIQTILYCTLISELYLVVINYLSIVINLLTRYKGHKNNVARR